MRHIVPVHWSSIAIVALTAGLVWPSPAHAQSVAGQARAVQASVVSLFGISTTVLSDTGTLSSTADAREASQSAGSVSTLLRGNTLHASTIGWSDRVASEASIADLAVTVGGITIGADFVMSRAVAVPGGGAGSVNIDGLAINGIPVDVTGTANQTLSIPGGQLVINEQRTSASGTIVNALRVIVNGVADVIIASSAAGVQ